MFPLPANIYAEIAAFLTSVIFWGNIKSSKLRWFCPFLFFILAIELLGRYIYKELHVSNAGLYNLSVPVEYLFYAYLFYSFYTRRFNKNLAVFFLIVFPVWVLVSLVFINGFYLFNDNFLMTGSISMVLFCFLFFIELLMNEELVNPFRQPIFWIACGLFLFNAGEFTYNTFLNILIGKWAYGKKLFEQINNNLIFVLYTSIIIAIIIPTWIPKEKT